jgi:hypothetical protein
MAIVLIRKQQATRQVNPIKLIAAAAIILGGVVAALAAVAVQMGERDQFIDLAVIQ